MKQPADNQLMSLETFEAVMPFFATRAGSVSKEIALAHYVMGLPTGVIMTRVGTSKQNIVKTISRFAEAHYRLQQAERHMIQTKAAAAASPQIAEILARFEAAAEPRKKTAAKKAAAKPALKVVAAKKTAAKTPAKKPSK